MRHLRKQTANSAFSSEQTPAIPAARRGKRRRRAILAACIESLEGRRLMSTAVWTGAAGNANYSWNNPANWQGDVVPTSGQDVDLPASAAHAGVVITVDTSVTVGNISFDASNYQINTQNSATLTVDGDIQGTGTSLEIGTLVLGHNTTITLAAGSTFSTNSIDDGGNHYGITEEGAGFAEIGPATYTGSTVVAQGQLDVEDPIASTVTVDPGAELSGIATVGGIIDNGGTFYASEGGGDYPYAYTTTGAATFGTGSTFHEQIGPSNNSDLIASGSAVSLTGTSLVLSLFGGATPSVGTHYTVITTSQAVSGTFTGLAQGATISSDGFSYQISYTGGSSDHDVVLTVTSVPAIWKQSGGGQWTTASNWLADAVPTAGEDVYFPDLNGANIDNINLASDVTVGSIAMDGNYYFGNSTMTIDGDITSTNNNSSFGSTVILGHNTTVNIGASGYLTMNDPLGDGGNHYGFIKQGPGWFSLTGGSTQTYSGATTIDQGFVDVENTDASSFTIEPGAILAGGDGQVGGITGAGGTLQLSDYNSPTTLTSTGTVTLSNTTTFDEAISNGSNGELIASGPNINLAGATLEISPASEFTPALGDVITLVSNLTGHAVTGTFAGLPQGAITTVDGVHYQVSYDAGESGHDVTLTVVNQGPAPTVVSVMSAVSTNSSRPTLSILGEDPDTENDSDLTYTWTVAHAPSGAKAVKFSENGTNAAKNATARFQKAGTYHLLCTVNNGDGGTVTQLVSVTIKQVATSLRLAPHKDQITAGTTVQYSGVVLDQFKHAMPTTSISYAVNTGNGTIDDAGLFTAGEDPGHVVIQMTVNGLTGTVGATVD
jgi:autotransporter-associated beta strand protein